MYALQKSTKMSKKSSLIARRAWNILRLALMWARKGGIIRNRHFSSLSEFSKLIKKLLHSNDARGALAYGDREFSFDDTPIIHVKMHRPSSMRFKLPHIPCIKPQVDFDYDFEFDDEDCVNEDEICYGGDYEEEEDINGGCDEGIDLKAEKFIANFYEEIKLQRQISYLQYDNTMKRGSS
ncbi:hypothetical protein CDL12_19890 [Handroanthus impetiginosus]|uniref:Uncharacterized protein n=1 Tax=Handroanthus impetiginosus TaxID=429701 RepID=A0A2G9GQF3_9LAMI|nr:hypothetical protein CDL12_19890 [Handroanthus impetiginosus]